MPASSPSRLVRFATTRWSLVAAAGAVEREKQQTALEELCRGYWPPLYAYLRQQGHDRHQAQDTTQAFLADLLSRNAWKVAAPQRGRFRTFLLACLKNFLSHQREKQQAKKRGGSQLTFSLHQPDGELAYDIASREATPEQLFERAWLTIVVQQVVERFIAEGKSAEDRATLQLLLPYVIGVSPQHAEVAEKLGLTPVALRQKLSRLRRKYQQVLLAVVGDTLGEGEDVESEIQYLWSLAGGR